MTNLHLWCDFKASSCPGGGWTALIRTKFMISLPVAAARAIEPALFLGLCVVFSLPPMQVDITAIGGPPRDDGRRLRSSANYSVAALRHALSTGNVIPEMIDEVNGGLRGLQQQRQLQTGGSFDEETAVHFTLTTREELLRELLTKVQAVVVEPGPLVDAVVAAVKQLGLVQALQDAGGTLDGLQIRVMLPFVFTGKLPEEGTAPPPAGLDPFAILIAVLIGIAIIITLLKRFTGIDLVAVVISNGKGARVARGGIKAEEAKEKAAALADAPATAAAVEKREAEAESGTGKKKDKKGGARK